MNQSSVQPIENKFKAFILHFMYLGVDATDASNERKQEKSSAYAAAARELLKSNHGVEIKAETIRRYYVGVKSSKWDAWAVGIAIAGLVKEEDIVDAMMDFKPVGTNIRFQNLINADSWYKKRNVSNETQQLVSEASKVARSSVGTNAVRKDWVRQCFKTDESEHTYGGGLGW